MFKIGQNIKMEKTYIKLCVCMCVGFGIGKIYWWSEKTQPNEMLILLTHTQAQMRRAIYLWQLTLLTANNANHNDWPIQA